MKKLESDVALELLCKDVIRKSGDINAYENRWVRHCIFVGIAAGRIARNLNNNRGNYTEFFKLFPDVEELDEDYAISLGYVHDIGRKIDHPKHTTEGYKYLMEAGYEIEAGIALTHSFIDNDINNSADPVSGEDRYKFINDYLHSVELTPYDNIVQLCDLFCLETGFTTVERRLLDITSRKGLYENSRLHLNKTMELLHRFELDPDYKKIMAQELGVPESNFSFYSMFPEISAEELNAAYEDYKSLVKLIEGGTPSQDGKVLARK